MWQLVTVHAMNDPFELGPAGACSGTPGPGGWAAILRKGDRVKEISGGEPLTTNNRMELRSVIEGLRALNKAPVDVDIHLDSAYVENAFTKDWLSKWIANGWRTSNKQPV